MPLYKLWYHETRTVERVCFVEADDPKSAEKLAYNKGYDEEKDFGFIETDLHIEEVE